MLAVAATGTLALRGATRRDLEKVRSLLDLPAYRGASTEPPLLTVRFVDRLDDTGVRRLVGPRYATDGRCLLMRSGQGWARLPIGDENATSELVCERGVDEVPHLVDLLNLAALQRGVLPLHAAALSRSGEGILLLGWSQGGKTEAVLARTACGDALVGDEWVHLDSAQVVRGIGYRMRVWAWQLEQAPHVAGAIARRERMRVRLIGSALRVAPARLRAPLARRHGVYLNARRALGALHVDSAPVRRVVLLESHTSDACSTQSAIAHEVAERACVSNRFERRGLAESYAALRFALPGLRDSRIEQADARELALAVELLGTLPAQVVRHPHPVRLARLAPLV